MVFPEPDNTTTMASGDRPKTHIIPAAHGYAFEVKKGEHFRVVDLKGEQIIDFAAWAKDTHLKEKLSMSYSRYHLNGVQPAEGECLWSNADEPMLKVVRDTVKVHDMTFMSCMPELYAKKGLKDHRSCASNIAEVMKPYGMKSHLEVTDPYVLPIGECLTDSMYVLLTCSVDSTSSRTRPTTPSSRSAAASQATSSSSRR